MSYSLKPVKASEVPTRGKWKAIAEELIDQLDRSPERFLEVLNNGEPITSKRELMSLYDALKSLKKRNKLNIEVKIEKRRLFLIKEMRYFVR